MTPQFEYYLNPCVTQRVIEMVIKMWIKMWIKIVIQIVVEMLGTAFTYPSQNGPYADIFLNSDLNNHESSVRK